MQWQCWVKSSVAKATNQEELAGDPDSLPTDWASETGDKLVWPTTAMSGGKSVGTMTRAGPFKPKLLFAGQRCVNPNQRNKRQALPGIALLDTPEDCSDNCVDWVKNHGRLLTTRGVNAWEKNCKYFEMASDHDSTASNRKCDWNYGTCGETELNRNVDVYENAHVMVCPRALASWRAER